MNRRLTTVAIGLAVAGIALGQAPGPSRPLPRPEAVAETRLLMDGLAQPNYQGLERSLAQKPADAEAWAFARGQALLLAETGNLLMLRPPRSEGRDVWMERAADLRAVAVKVARSASSRDYDQARSQLPSVAMMCNRCHRAFRVPVEVGAAQAPAERGPRPPVP